MTEELKHKFEQLVADPPPPSGVPSQAVFARVRTVRRRRTTGVVTLVAAAVIAVAVAAGNLTDINSSPPVTHTPSAPVTIVTAAPTITPSSTPSTTPTKTPSGNTSTQVTGAAHAPNTNTNTITNTPPPNNTPPPQSHTPAAPPLGVHVSLNPTVQGMTVTMKVTLSGTELVPTEMESHRQVSTSDSDFLNLLGGTRVFFGDGGQSGSDPGTVGCVSGTDRITRHQTYTLRDETAVDPSIASTHTYTKAGTYNFKYTVKYCGDSGWVPVTKTTQVTVR